MLNVGDIFAVHYFTLTACDARSVPRKAPILPVRAQELIMAYPAGTIGHFTLLIKALMPIAVIKDKNIEPA